jgi:hypothetical protein
MSIEIRLIPIAGVGPFERLCLCFRYIYVYDVTLLGSTCLSGDAVDRR